MTSNHHLLESKNDPNGASYAVLGLCFLRVAIVIRLENEYMKMLEKAEEVFEAYVQ